MGWAEKMFKKFVVAAFAVSALAGCASFPGSAARSRPGLDVRGDLIDLTQVKIFVNGDKVIDDQVSLLHGDGEFRGSYAGKPVIASCSTSSQPSRTTCLVSVDNDRPTALEF